MDLDFLGGGVGERGGDLPPLVEVRPRGLMERDLFLDLDLRSLDLDRRGLRVRDRVRERLYL